MTFQDRIRELLKTKYGYSFYNKTDDELFNVIKSLSQRSHLFGKLLLASMEVGEVKINYGIVKGCRCGCCNEYKILVNEGSFDENNEWVENEVKVANEEWFEDREIEATINKLEEIIKRN
jgi:hypothetical protein